MEEITLSVEARNDRGKGAARRLRRSGKVPAVFYGPKSTATPIARSSATATAAQQPMRWPLLGEGTSGSGGDAIARTLAREARQRQCGMR